VSAAPDPDPLAVSTSTAKSTLPRRPVRVDTQSRLLKLALIASVGVHAALFVGWLVWPSSSKAAIDLDEAVIKTRLVKLGKPRDEKLLPRMPTSAPPPPAERLSPNLDPNTPTNPDTKPTPDQPNKLSAAEILEKFKSDATPRDINDLIKDRFGEPTDEGREDGDVDGSALDGEVKASYFARVTSRIQKAMEVSSVLSDDERVRLKAVLCLKIDESGALSDLTVKTSGSSVFDSDVMAAAQRASPVPAPPPPARDQSASGVCFNFCPTSCR
jgi:TonB family protein